MVFQTIAHIALIAILCGVAVVDIKTRTIPNGFIIAGCVLWLITVWFEHVPVKGFAVGTLFAPWFGQGFLAVFVDGLCGALVVGGGVFAFSLLFEKITGRTSMGGGDVKLLFMVSLFLGLAGAVFNVIIACLCGLVFSLGWALCIKRSSHIKDEQIEEALEQTQLSTKKTITSFKTQTFPFGPAISVATIASLFLANPFLTWYFG